MPIRDANTYSERFPAITAPAGCSIIQLSDGRLVNAGTAVQPAAVAVATFKSTGIESASRFIDMVLVHASTLAVAACYYYDSRA